MFKPIPTDELPDPDRAYRYRCPTGALTDRGELAYGKWTPFMPFSGDWETAQAYGIQRSTKSRSPRVQSEDDIFWFPNAIWDSTGDATADVLRDAYRDHFLQILEGRGEGGGLPVDWVRKNAARAAQNPQHAVTVKFTYDGEWPPDELVEGIHDLGDELRRIVGETSTGEYDGDEFGQGEARLFLYGPDADRLLAAIEKALRSSPWLRDATVTRAYGESWAPDLRVVESPLGE